MSWCIKNWRAIIAPFVISNVPCNFKDTLNQSFGYQCPLTRGYCYYRFKIWSYTRWNQMTPQIVLNQGIFLFNSCVHYFQSWTIELLYFRCISGFIEWNSTLSNFRLVFIAICHLHDTILWWMSWIWSLLDTRHGRPVTKIYIDAID